MVPWGNENIYQHTHKLYTIRVNVKIIFQSNEIVSHEENQSYQQVWGLIPF